MVSDSEMRHLWAQRDKDEAKFKRELSRRNAADNSFEASHWPQMSERQKAGIEL